MKRDNLAFWGSHRVAGVVRSRGKRKLKRSVHNAHLSQVPAKGTLTDCPVSRCFQLNSSGLQKVTQPKLTVIDVVIQNNFSPHSHWLCCQQSAQVINLWTPQKGRSQIPFRWSQTKAIRQAVPGKWTLQEHERLGSPISSLRAGILAWGFPSACLGLGAGFLRFFPNQPNGTGIWIQSRSVNPLGQILVCHCLREKNNIALIPKSLFHFIFSIQSLSSTHKEKINLEDSLYHNKKSLNNIR